MSELSKMLSGALYRPSGDPELTAHAARARQLMAVFNSTPDPDERRSALAELVGDLGEGAVIRPPFHCDYGNHISMGAGAFMNFGGVILDCAPVTIGALAQIGPNVQLLAADHPREPDLRRDGWEMAKPVHVGANTWLGGGVIVCPGVTIGDDSIIGAGSVVARDIPAGVVAAGNPCRVVRELG
jgi:maltose O-acetyltransferase